MLLPWLIFLLSALVIAIAGVKLSEFGDRLADQTGLGGLWIGVVLMAGATSLPEVFTTVSAAMLGIPDLVAGDLLGAGLTNMLTLGIIDQLFRQKRVWQQAALGHTLIASLAMVLTALAGLFVALKWEFGVWNIGIDSLILLVLYVLGMRLVYRQEDVTRRQKEAERVIEAVVGHDEKAVSRSQGVRRTAVGFAIAALAIVMAAPFLASSAEQIAEQTGMTRTFVGTFLLAIATSLPELVTSIAAVRLGAFDLAVGNLFGSNAFNMGAIFFADAAYRQGPLLSSVSVTHTLTAFWAILLMNVGLMGIIYRAEKRYYLIEPDSFLMILGYILGMWMLFG